MPASSALALLDRDDVESVYLLVPLFDGRDAVPFGVDFEDAERLLTDDFDLAGGDPPVYVSHDVEDRSLYLGRDPGETYH